MALRVQSGVFSMAGSMAGMGQAFRRIQIRLWARCSRPPMSAVWRDDFAKSDWIPGTLQPNKPCWMKAVLRAPFGGVRPQATFQDFPHSHKSMFRGFRKVETRHKDRVRP
jgi:hypothetical protein